MILYKKTVNSRLIALKMVMKLLLLLLLLLLLFYRIIVPPVMRYALLT